MPALSLQPRELWLESDVRGHAVLQLACMRQVASTVAVHRAWTHLLMGWVSVAGPANP